MELLAFVKDWFLAHDETILWSVLWFAGLLMAFGVFRHVILKKLRKLVGYTTTGFDDQLLTAVQKIPTYFYIGVALYVPIKLYVFDHQVIEIADGIFVVLVVYQVIQSVQGLLQWMIARAILRRDSEEEPTSAIGGIGVLVKIVLWSIGLLLILSNLGVNVSSLVASLGIGGIAVALAVQNILSDIFSSFSIYFDKPFEVGDYIAVSNGDNGHVKRVGMKTTRVKTLHGEELVLSNKELTSCRIRNFGRMEKRRVEQVIKVVYETDLKKLKKAKELLQKSVEKVEGVEFGRVHFSEFGDYSLNFVLVYKILSAEYEDFMDCQELVNFEIKAAFEKAKIQLAFPVQEVRLVKS